MKQMEQKIAIIDGDNFSDLETFYDEVDRVLTKDIDFKTCHDLDAFNDILCGDFGVFSYNETLKLIWTNFTKSRKNLSDELISVLTGIIKEHDHIEFQTIN